MDFHLPRFNSVSYGKHSIRYSVGPYIWSRLDSKIKDKPTLQSFKSSIRRINLVDLISENCGSCPICSTREFLKYFKHFSTYFNGDNSVIF